MEQQLEEFFLDNQLRQDLDQFVSDDSDINYSDNEQCSESSIDLIPSQLIELTEESNEHTWQLEGME